VRTRNVFLHVNQMETEAKWHEIQLDDKTLYVAVA
jgi:hypothetical protein